VQLLRAYEATESCKDNPPICLPHWPVNQLLSGAVSSSRAPGCRGASAQGCARVAAGAARGERRANPCSSLFVGTNTGGCQGRSSTFLHHARPAPHRAPSPLAPTRSLLTTPTRCCSRRSPVNHIHRGMHAAPCRQWSGATTPRLVSPLRRSDPP